MEYNKMPDFVIDALHLRGHKTQDISAMTPEEAFVEYCDWHGLCGWGSILISALDSLRAANIDKLKEGK
jgi:hypothetical protein